MTEILLFPDTRDSLVADLDEDLVRRDIVDRLERDTSGFSLIGDHRDQIARVITQLLVECATEWIRGYVFASDVRPHHPDCGGSGDRGWGGCICDELEAQPQMNLATP